MADDVLPGIKTKRKPRRVYGDVTGMAFFHLTAISPAEPDAKGRSMWAFLCECGVVVNRAISAVASGNTKSCGCRKTRVLSERGKKSVKELHAAQVTHGMTGTRLYRMWKNMKARCYNTRVTCYPEYGGRGISMCDEWRTSSAAFMSWAVANGYSDNLEIDRRDNDGNYCPDNCRFITRQMQCNNKRSNSRITHDGETLTYAQWEHRLELPECTISDRIKRGWSPEKCVTTPRRGRRGTP